jgi:hypothetical protein
MVKVCCFNHNLQFKVQLGALDDPECSSSKLQQQRYLYGIYCAAEGFIRGRSYNIKIDENVLLRFSPKNSDSTYYFGDMVISPASIPAFLLISVLIDFRSQY